SSGVNCGSCWSNPAKRAGCKNRRRIVLSPTTVGREACASEGGAGCGGGSRRAPGPVWPPGTERLPASLAVRAVGRAILDRMPRLQLPTDLPFEVGALYNRRQQIHGPLGGQRQGGISTPSSSPFVI